MKRLLNLTLFQVCVLLTVLMVPAMLLGVSGCSPTTPDKDSLSIDSLITTVDTQEISQMRQDHEQNSSSVSDTTADAYRLIAVKGKDNQQQESSGWYFLFMGSYQSGTSNEACYLAYAQDATNAIRIVKIPLSGTDDTSDNTLNNSDFRILEDSSVNNAYIVIGSAESIQDGVVKFYVIHVPPHSIDKTINMNLP